MNLFLTSCPCLILYPHYSQFPVLEHLELVLSLLARETGLYTDTKSQNKIQFYV